MCFLATPLLHQQPREAGRRATRTISSSDCAQSQSPVQSIAGLRERSIGLFLTHLADSFARLQFVPPGASIAARLVADATQPQKLGLHVGPPPPAPPSMHLARR